MARRRPEVDDADEDTPPWMERAPTPRRVAPAEAAPSHTVISWRALLIGAAVAIAVAIGLVIGVRSLIAREPGATTAANGDVPLIRAPAEPYKVKPADAGGAQLAGADASLLAPGDPATGGATDPGATIDTSAAPETPARPAAPPTDLMPAGSDAASPEAGDAALVAPPPAAKVAPDAPPASATKPASPTKPPFRPKPKPAPVETATASAQAPAPKPHPKPKSAPDQPSRPERFELPAADVAEAVAHGGGAALQLGAFSSRAKADAAWDRFTSSYDFLTGLHKQVEPIIRDGATLYRLRATGVGSRGVALCAKLKAAGESCLTT